MGLASAPPTGTAAIIRRAFENGWGFCVTKVRLHPVGSSGAHYELYISVVVVLYGYVSGLFLCLLLGSF